MPEVKGLLESTLLSVSCELVLNLALAPSRTVNLTLAEVSHLPSRAIVQVPNLALVETKRITV